MQTPSFIEDHVSQIPAIQLLINMGYNYVSPEEAQRWRNHKNASVLFESVLRKQLKKINSIQRKGQTYQFSDSNINNAIIALKDLPVQNGFLHANAALYDLLTLGKSLEQTIDGDKKSHTLHYIDWEKPKNNVFHITEEFSVLRDGRSDTYRPDLVLFINGIPTVIIECKSPGLNGTKTPTELAIEQHIRNFSADAIRSLYVYSSLLISIATNEGKYATTGTSKEFWAKWKEQFPTKKRKTTYNQTLQELKNKPLDKAVKKALFSDRFYYTQSYFDSLETTERVVTVQDKLLYSLCHPKRLLDLIRNFTIYDDGIKKIARYQQYFAVNQTLKRVSKYDSEEKRKGGVIWHTQGSGKSLTMVMLAQLIAASKKISNPKIILVTDRVDLDDQISDTFKKCQKEVVQATTGSHLTDLLEGNADAIITTIINKFEAAVKQVKHPFQSSEIFVLIDEGHRTQYGTFNVNMQRVFPNACFIAFTGTPLMKREKSTAEKFGGYIGEPYTVEDAVADGAVVPLLYEGRHNLITLNADPINRYFDKVAEPLTPYGKAALKRKFNTIDQLNKADQVIYARAWDISEHYTQFFQTHEDKFKPKAQLVAPNIKSALLYKEYLDEIDRVSSAVIVTRTDQREGTEDGFYNTNPNKEREDRYFSAMEDKYGSLKNYEKSIINQFKKREHPEILIVVAKLLTGFDAPNNTVLYLCRSLKEHTLLQAVARVNRVYPGKDYGYIIDYYGNLEHLDKALITYSGTDGFDPNDLKGMFKKLEVEIDKLPQAHADLWDIFKSIRNQPVEIPQFEEILRPEDIRTKFYERLSNYARLLKMALSSVDFVINADPNKIDAYKKDAKFFLKLRVSAKRRYNDDLSYREFEPKIQKLINQHISTEGDILKITDLVNIFDKEERETEIEKLTGKAAKADHIASRTIKAINVKMEEDPIFYKKLADLIKETIDAYLQKRIDESEYLNQVKDIEEKFLNGAQDDIPEKLIEKPAATAFYNILLTHYDQLADSQTNFWEEAALGLDEIIKEHIYLEEKKIIEWHKNEDVTGKINIEFGDFLYDLHQSYALEMDWDKVDVVIESCIKIAITHYQ